MKKAKLPLLCVLLCFALLSACGNNDMAEPAQTPLPQTTSPTVGTSKPEPEPWVIEWDPHASSNIYAEIFDSATIANYHALVDAILAGADSAPCANVAQWWYMLSMIRVQYPLCDYVLAGVDGIKYDEQAGCIILTYAMEGEERQAFVESFQEQVQHIVSQCVFVGDNALGRAAALHAYLAEYFEYDYDTLENEGADFSPYRAIMTGKGICQSYAAAYAYIALQLGVDAIVVSGTSADFAHEWNVITLDGVSYYADVTFECGEGYGLRFFGMTTEQRATEGGFDDSRTNIGGVNLLRGPDFPLTDERFAPLWNAASLEKFAREEGFLVAHLLDGAYEAFVFEFKP